MFPLLVCFFKWSVNINIYFTLNFGKSDLDFLFLDSLLFFCWFWNLHESFILPQLQRILIYTCFKTSNWKLKFNVLHKFITKILCSFFINTHISKKIIQLFCTTKIKASTAHVLSWTVLCESVSVPKDIYIHFLSVHLYIPDTSNYSTALTFA